MNLDRFKKWQLTMIGREGRVHDFGRFWTAAGAYMARDRYAADAKRFGVGLKVVRRG